VPAWPKPYACVTCWMRLDWRGETIYYMDRCNVVAAIFCQVSENLLEIYEEGEQLLEVNYNVYVLPKLRVLHIAMDVANEIYSLYLT